MRTVLFDTLEFAKTLKAANFSDTQAEALAQAVAGIVEEQLATKRDLKEMEVGLKRDLQEMELRLRHDLTLRLGAMLVAGISIIAALLKFL
jgi:hypothetical protein